MTPDPKLPFELRPLADSDDRSSPNVAWWWESRYVEDATSDSAWFFRDLDPPRPFEQAEGFSTLQRMWAKALDSDAPTWTQRVTYTDYPDHLKENPVSQELRNKIYAVATAVIGTAVILGFFAPADADTALGLISQVLDVAATALALGTAVLAFVKSLPSKVRTVKADDPSTPA